MKIILLITALLLSLHAQIVGGVCAIVKGDAITLHELQNEMQLSKLTQEKALDQLIRKKLELQEIESKGLDVSASEVYEDIKQTAERNNMSVSAFYDAVRDANGLSSNELKEKIKEKLLSQKLYQSITYSALQEPTDEEMTAYYETNKAKYSHAVSFDVTIYQATSKESLEAKRNNPLLQIPEVGVIEQNLLYEKLPPELASILERTELDSFTPVLPSANGGFMSFYLKQKVAGTPPTIESLKESLLSAIMQEKREQILRDHFERLRHNAEIKIVRMLN